MNAVRFLFSCHSELSLSQKLKLQEKWVEGGKVSFLGMGFLFFKVHHAILICFKRRDGQVKLCHQFFDYFVCISEYVQPGFIFKGCFLLVNDNHLTYMGRYSKLALPSLLSALYDTWRLPLFETRPSQSLPWHVASRRHSHRTTYNLSIRYIKFIESFIEEYHSEVSF